MQKEFGRITYLPFAKNVGYAKLVNTGLRIAKRPYLLIMNADVHVDAKDIAEILAFTRAHSKVGAVGVTGCFRFPTLGAILARRTAWAKTSWGKKALHRYELTDYDRKTPMVVDWVRGDCWMIPRSAVKRVGLLDEQFFMYFEDTDWCRRAKEKGLNVYFLPGITVEQRQLGASRQHSVRGVSYRLSHLKSLFKYLRKWNLSKSRNFR